MTTKYTDDHEWVTLEGDIVTIGITGFAAKAIGEAVFAEPPEVGASFDSGDDMGVIDSSKASSEIFAPVSGEVTARNEAWDDPDELDDLMADPTGKGWFCKMKISDAGQLDGLMDKAAYDTFCEGLD